MRSKTVIIVSLSALLVLGLVCIWRSTLVTTVDSQFGNSQSSITLSPTQVSPSSKNKQLKTILTTCFKDLEIPESQIKQQLFLEDSTLEIKTSVPKGKPIEWIIWYISSAMINAGYTLEDCFYESEQKGCSIYFINKKSDLPKVSLKIKRSNTFYSKTATMAILVEDFGFEANETSVGFLSFPEPLSVALVSNKKLSTWTAQIANEYHKEIVILLPMEPLPREYLIKYKDNQIMVHYSEEKIRSLITQSTQMIPNFAGFCSFYGERVLEDSRVMEILFKEIKKKHGYFIIVPASRKSVAEQLAKKMDQPFKRIDFTLNTEHSADVLQDSLRICAIHAQKTGSVLVRGKASAPFISALKNSLPIFNQNGIKLVYISELLKQH